MKGAARADRPVITRLRIRNYRVLRDVTFAELSPLTVLFGPNGSGKSTVMDVFAFLHEAFSGGLRSAWDRRNRIAEIRTRGSSGPVSFEIKYRESRDAKLVTYELEIDEVAGLPVIVKERVAWTIAPGQGRPKDILLFHSGSGVVYDDVTGESTREELASPDLLAVSALGQLTRHPRVAALRRFVTGWYLSYVSADRTRTTPEGGPQSRLSATGDNLPNVVQWLQEQHPERLRRIVDTLGRRVPKLADVRTETMPDGRLLLRFLDAPFSEPVLSKFVSDGTLKLLSYLVVLDDPEPATIIGIEEPENQLHPKLLMALAEELRAASARSQLIVTTHAPQLADALRPREVWAVFRGDDGFSRVARASDEKLLMRMVEAGGHLGDLWMEGYFRAADPPTLVAAP